MTEPAAPDPDLPDAGPGTCTSCGAPLAPEQDWCLACGTGSPGRIGALPGLRTAGKVGVLTLVLVILAVGASYAALNHGGKTMVIAQAPPPPTTTKTTPATTPKATTPATTTTTDTTTTDTTQAPTVESVPTVPPDDFSDTFPVDTTPAAGRHDAGRHDADRDHHDDDQHARRRRRPTTPPKTTPDKPKSTKIKLPKNAVAVYDPMTRVQSSTPPKFATDNDPSTLFTLNTAPSSDGPQAGMTIDLGSAQKATKIKIETPTPGFGGLVYGAVGPDIPKTLTDPGWKHLRNFSDAGSADGTATITLGKHGAGVDSYRYLMLWITNPPPSRARRARRAAVDRSRGEHDRRPDHAAGDRDHAPTGVAADVDADDTARARGDGQHR